MQSFDGTLPKSFIQDKQVVAIGESTHGTHEFFVAKTSIIKDLVENHGFNTLYFEDQSNPFENSSPAETVRNLYSIWRTEEVLNMLEWAHAQPELQIVGFDIDQGTTPPDKRDRHMADKILQHLSPDTKAVVWAHNAHVEKSPAENHPHGMGHYLHRALGEQYAAIGQYTHSGTFSATALDPANYDAYDRSLSVVDLPAAPREFLEHALMQLGDQPMLLDSAAMPSGTYPARSLGWGLVPDQVNEIKRPVDVSKQLDAVIFYPTTMASTPLTF